METGKFIFEPLRARLFVLVMVLVLLVTTSAGCASGTASVLTQDLSEPLGTATTAKIDINRYSGNLVIDPRIGSDDALAKGTLEYLDNQELTHSVNTSDGQAVLALKTSAAKQTRLPWVGCEDDTEWQIHLNPSIPAEIIAFSGGGEMKLDLTGMTVTRVSAEIGGGNVEVVLPESAANLSVTAKTGAGNVTVHVPGMVAARIHIASGLGDVSVDSRFNKIDNTTYQSPDYEGAANTAEITLNSGAGNVSVITTN